MEFKDFTSIEDLIKKAGGSFDAMKEDVPPFINEMKNPKYEKAALILDQLDSIIAKEVENNVSGPVKEQIQDIIRQLKNTLY